MSRPRPVELAVAFDDGTAVTTLINPQRDLADARMAYGISVSDVLLAPTLREAWAVIAPMLAGCTPVGAGVDEQLGLIDFELKRLGYVTPMPLGVELRGAAGVRAHRAGTGPLGPAGAPGGRRARTARRRSRNRTPSRCRACWSAGTSRCRRRKPSTCRGCRRCCGSAATSVRCCWVPPRRCRRWTRTPAGMRRRGSRWPTSCGRPPLACSCRRRSWRGCSDVSSAPGRRDRLGGSAFRARRHRRRPAAGACGSVSPVPRSTRTAASSSAAEMEQLASAAGLAPVHDRQQDPLRRAGDRGGRNAVGQGAQGGRVRQTGVLRRRVLRLARRAADDAIMADVPVSAAFASDNAAPAHPAALEALAARQRRARAVLRGRRRHPPGRRRAARGVRLPRRRRALRVHRHRGQHHRARLGGAAVARDPVQRRRARAARRGGRAGPALRCPADAAAQRRRPDQPRRSWTAGSPAAARCTIRSPASSRSPSPPRTAGSGRLRDINGLRRATPTSSACWSTSTAPVWRMPLSHTVSSPADAIGDADIVTVGGTKNGMLFGDALLVRRPEHFDGIHFVQKQIGQLASKHRFVAAQFLAFFTDDLWLRTAAHANAMARTLSAGLRAVGSATGVAGGGERGVRDDWTPRLRSRLARSYAVHQPDLGRAGVAAGVFVGHHRRRRRRRARRTRGQARTVTGSSSRSDGRAAGLCCPPLSALTARSTSRLLCEPPQRSRAAMVSISARGARKGHGGPPGSAVRPPVR